jgi:hypothetical protein
MAIRKIVSRSIGVDVIAAEDLANNSVTAAEIQDGVIGLAKLSATGTKDATTFLRGDNSFQAVDVNDITGNFTVDTDVLVVDSTNDRVGVNEASPSHPLHIQASAAGETTMKVESNQAGAMNVAFDVDTDRDLVLQMQEAGTTRWDFLMNGSSGTNPLILRNQSGTTIQKFTQEGYITKPNNPAWYARGLTLNSSTAGTIFIFPTVEINRANGYNNTTGKFTAPVSGIYHVVSQTYRNSGSSDSSVYIVKNSSAVTELRVQTGTATGYVYQTGSIVMEMSAGDTAHIELRSGDTHTNSSWSYFGGYLVG